MAIERTLVVIKPDGVRRGLADEVIKRYTDQGLKVIAQKKLTVTKDFAARHYQAHDQQILGMGNKTLGAAKEAGKENEVLEIFGSDDPRKVGNMLRDWMINFLTSGPVAAFVLEGEGAVALVRKITGFTDPSKAEKGTIRGDLGEDSILKANQEKRATENLVHASGSVEEANMEIALWFTPEELK